jgi:imidazolonepropionase-like amidohydrolase
MLSMRLPPALVLGLLVTSACAAHSAHSSHASSGDSPSELDVPSEWLDPEALLPTPRRVPGRQAPTPGALVVRHATILTATGKRIDDGSIVLANGKIAALGDASLAAPAGAREIDGKGRFVTPGIIDTHSHLGVYAVPDTRAHDDGNEHSDPNTAQVAAEWAYDAQDPAITRALAGGVTVAQILPGSANLIGGRGVVVEMHPGAAASEVRFPGAKPTIKMACGENPKRAYAAKGGPQTRMGEYAAFRAAFRAAADYNRTVAIYRKKRREWEARRDKALALDRKRREQGKKSLVKAEAAPDLPPRDARNQVLGAVLRGEVLVQVHCYTQQDMLQMLAIADEFGFQIRSFHHALEAYKIRDIVVAHGTAISTWADWWGFKLEAFDGIPENAALFLEQGGRVAIHSDSAIGIQRLNQEAAKAMAAGRAAGIDVSDDAALRWLTANPAWILGIDDQTGTLEVGKRADVVVWSASPFSVYAKADLVVVGGIVRYERARGLEPTDFELGNSSVGVAEVAK